MGWDGGPVGQVGRGGRVRWRFCLGGGERSIMGAAVSVRCDRFSDEVVAMKWLSWLWAACLLVLALSAPVALAQDAGSGETYCWPLELPWVLTSSFGEYCFGGSK